MSDLKDQDDQFRLDFNEVRHEHFLIEDKIQQREHDIELIKEEIRKWQITVTSNKTELSSLQRELDGLRLAQKRLEDQLALLKRDLNDELVEGGRIKTDHSEVGLTLKRLVGDVNESNARIKQLEAEIAASRREQINTNGELSSLKAEISDIDSQICFLTDKRRSFQLEIDRILRQINDLSIELSNLRTARADFDNSVANDRARIAGLQDDIRITETRISTDLKTIDQLESDKSELVRNIGYVEVKIRDSQAHLDGLISKHRVLESDNDILVRDVNLLPAHLRGARVTEVRQSSGGDDEEMSEAKKAKLRKVMGWS